MSPKFDLAVLVEEKSSLVDSESSFNFYRSWLGFVMVSCMVFVMIWHNTVWHLPLTLGPFPHPFPARALCAVLQAARPVLD